MSSDLEKVFNSVFDNKIPELWQKVNIIYLFNRIINLT
jgi:hypothetical protein